LRENNSRKVSLGVRNKCLRKLGKRRRVGRGRFCQVCVCVPGKLVPGKKGEKGRFLPQSVATSLELLFFEQLTRQNNS